MDVKVLYQGDCLEINNQARHHHKKGGGLVSATANAHEDAYIALGARVEDFATVEANVSLYNQVVVRDQAVIRSGVTLAGITVIGGDAEVVAGYIDVPYAITTGKINAGMSRYWGKVKKSLILPVEVIALGFDKLGKLVDELETVLNSE